MSDKPTGRDDVIDALKRAATTLMIDKGMAISVREIASLAGVNHGLIHTYFGSKDALLRAALDEINDRAAAELDAGGFPPADLATRRDGELAKAIARVRLEGQADPFSAHPVTEPWRHALARTRPEVNDDDLDLMVASASALGTGWALFGDAIAEALGATGPKRADLDQRIHRMVAELGGLPDQD